MLWILKRGGGEEEEEEEEGEEEEGVLSLKEEEEVAEEEDDDGETAAAAADCDLLAAAASAARNGAEPAAAAATTAARRARSSGAAAAATAGAAAPAEALPASDDEERRSIPDLFAPNNPRLGCCPRRAETFFLFFALTPPTFFSVKAAASLPTLPVRSLVCFSPGRPFPPIARQLCRKEARLPRIAPELAFAPVVRAERESLFCCKGEREIESSLSTIS